MRSWVTEGLRRESKRLGVDDLLALADVARLSGHPAEAVMPLDRILSEFANDAQAPLAAFALGRLEMDSLGHAQAAASAFRKALMLGIPRGLREDVRARLVEAYARSGDARAAQRAADAYLDEIPEGSPRASHSRLASPAMNVRLPVVFPLVAAWVLAAPGSRVVATRHNPWSYRRRFASPTRFR